MTKSANSALQCIDGRALACSCICLIIAIAIAIDIDHDARNDDEVAIKQTTNHNCNQHMDMHRGATTARKSQQCKRI